MSDEATAVADAPADAPTESFSAEAETFVDGLMGKTLKELIEIRDCLKAHGVEPAAGGAVMVAGGGGDGDGAAAAEEQTEFDVVMESFGDNKIGVIKAIRGITGLGLKEAKEMVESAPTKVKEGVSKEEAEKVEGELKEAGASVSVK